MSSTVNGSDTPEKDTKAEYAQITANIEADVAELNELLSRDTLDDAEEASVAQLLARLEKADGIATGVEDKLDALLGNLNTLLETLETKEDENEPKSTENTEPKSADK